MAFVTSAASGNTTVKAAVTGKRHVCRSVHLFAGGPVNVTLTSSGGTSYGPFPIDIGAPLIIPQSAAVLMEFAAGQAVVLNQDAAVRVSGFVDVEVRV